MSSMSGHNAHQARVYAERADPHALPSMTDPHTRTPREVYLSPDEIETECPACTLEWRDGGWHHDRACLFAGRRA
jgi:hypothetical protein